MVYSLEAMVSAFPDGLTQPQIAKMLHAAGITMSNKALRSYLKNSKEIRRENNIYRISRQGVEDAQDKSLQLAIRAVRASMQNFSQTLNESTRINQAKNEAARLEAAKLEVVKLEAAKLNPQLKHTASDDDDDTDDSSDSGGFCLESQYLSDFDPDSVPKGKFWRKKPEKYPQRQIEEERQH